MTREEILSRIRDVLLLENLVIVGYKPDERDRLHDDLGMAESEFLCAFNAIADDFGIDGEDAIDDAYETVETIGDLVDFVARYCQTDNTHE